MVALSTTEAEDTALSVSLHDVIPIMELLGEMSYQTTSLQGIWG